MSYACSVCGKKVNAEKNMFVEHKDRRGNICYGSFTPVQAFDPFKVKRATREGSSIFGEPIGGFPDELPAYDDPYP